MIKEMILQIAAWIETICTFISYAPQIYKLIKTKKSNDLSVTSWVLWSLSSLPCVTYVISIGRY